jgi:hypothetical protein
MELLDRIEARLEDTSSSYRRCRLPAASKKGEHGTRRCDMMPTVAVCVYCSHKIEEKEKSVNVPQLPGGVAHLACAQKEAIRKVTLAGLRRFPPDPGQHGALTSRTVRAPRA